MEHVFGTLKRSYGYQRVRYRGLARNTTEMWFKLLDLEGVAAVDDEGVAGDKRRVFGTEKGDGGGDVGGTAAAADGVLGELGGTSRPEGFWSHRLGLDALSNDVAGGDGVKRRVF